MLLSFLVWRAAIQQAMKHKTAHNEKSGIVPCPTCSNDEMDTLVWDDPNGEAEFVVCPVCGARYNPFTGELSWPF